MKRPKPRQHNDERKVHYLWRIGAIPRTVRCVARCCAWSPDGTVSMKDMKVLAPPEGGSWRRPCALDVAPFGHV
jgi:hypothetical protein